MAHNVIYLYPNRSPCEADEKKEPRHRVGEAISSCLRSLAEEATAAGMPVGAEAIELAVAIIRSELADFTSRSRRLERGGASDG